MWLVNNPRKVVIIMNKVQMRISNIYENEDIGLISRRIEKKLADAKARVDLARKPHWDEKDVVLITYGDQFYQEQTPTLASLKTFYKEYLSDKFEVVHILPFYPYSSDDGFSVIDYEKINPVCGDWEDLASLSGETRIMFDFVCNHISAQSAWFKGYLANDPEYQNFFVDVDPGEDLSAVTRPRTSPLLTPFTFANGEPAHIWTTFSDDQIDLNAANPEVLLRLIDVLLFYLEKGAAYIRLDAIGFMWKEIGTTCIHHQKTHEIVKLFRDIVDIVAPGTAIITETNVPHKDNIAYLGNNGDEAHMVYQFPLPPLVLHAIHCGNGEALTTWAKGLDLPERATFFNFLASHDGIGMNPLRGLVAEQEINQFVEELETEGALVSYKNNPDGTKSPYEINVTYFDALNKRADHDALRVQRFLLAHAILLGFPGVPAVYVQSMLGSRNDYDGVRETGRNRSINRQKYQLDAIKAELADRDSLQSQIFAQLTKMIQCRKVEALFHPNTPMEVADFGEKVFAFKRINKSDYLFAIYNLTNEIVTCPLVGGFTDIVTGEEIHAQGDIQLEPYQFCWLKK